jgi:hypothetical protein
MKLIKLDIELQRWGEQKGQYVGAAKFEGSAGAVTLNLNAHHCEQIFKVCAEGIIDVAKASARMVLNEAIAHNDLPMIEKAKP